MSSISASDYRSACAEFIRGAVQKPRMYYASLADLQAQLRGHATAFQQLGAINRGESFLSAFAAWLYRTKGASGAAAGWAILIEEMAAATGADPDAVFRVQVEEFLLHWQTEG